MPTDGILKHRGRTAWPDLAMRRLGTGNRVTGRCQGAGRRRGVTKRRVIVNLVAVAALAVSAATSSLAADGTEPLVEIGWHPGAPPQTFDWQLFDKDIVIVPGDKASQTITVVNRGPSAAKLQAEIFVTEHSVPTAETELWQYLQINHNPLDPQLPTQVVSDITIPACAANIKSLDCPSVPVKLDFEFVTNLAGSTPGNNPGGYRVSLNLEIILQGITGNNDYVDLWEINALPPAERIDPATGITRLHQHAEPFIVAEIGGVTTPVTVDLAGSGSLIPVPWLPGFTPVDIANIAEMVQTGTNTTLPLCNWEETAVTQVKPEYGYPIYRFRQVTCDTQLTVRHTVSALDVKPVPGMEPVHPNDFHMHLHQFAEYATDKEITPDRLAEVSVNDTDFKLDRLVHVSHVPHAHRPAGEMSEATLSVLNTHTYALTAYLDSEGFPHDSWAMRLARHDDYDHKPLPDEFLEEWFETHGSLVCDDEGTEDWSDGTDGTVTVLFGHRAICESVAHSTYLNVRTIVIDALGNVLDDHDLIGEHFTVEMAELVDGESVPRPLEVPKHWLADNNQFIKVRPGSHLQFRLISPQTGPFTGWVSIAHDRMYQAVAAEEFVIKPHHRISDYASGSPAAIENVPGGATTLAAWQRVTDGQSGELGTELIVAGIPSIWSGLNREGMSSVSHGVQTENSAPMATYHENCPDTLTILPETLTPGTAHQLTFVVVQPGDGYSETPQCGGEIAVGGGNQGDGSDGYRQGTSDQNSAQSEAASQAGLAHPAVGRGTSGTNWLTRTGPSLAILVGGIALVLFGLTQTRRRISTATGLHPQPGVSHPGVSQQYPNRKRRD